MDPIQSDYHSYLLRLWRVEEIDGPTWRASLEEVQTGELVGFADMLALVRYLQALESRERMGAGIQQQDKD